MVPPTDPFLDLCNATWAGLRDAARECGWIADGGDATATESDRDLASAKGDEYRQEAADVAERNLAYVAKKLSISPPSAVDVAAAQALAANLAAMISVNVKVSAVISAASGLLDLYNKSK